MVERSTAWGFWLMQTSHILFGISPQEMPCSMRYMGWWSERAWGMGHVSRVFFLSIVSVLSLPTEATLRRCGRCVAGLVLPLCASVLSFAMVSVSALPVFLH